MPGDEQYLADAGIDAETGNPVAETTAPEAATVSTPAATEGAPAPIAATPTKAAEMFEIAGQRYPVDTKFKLTHGGKIIEVPYSNMANTYRQWQHLQDKWNNEHKPRIEAFEKQRPEFDRYRGFYEKYGHLQEWSEKNPDDWASLFDYWQNRNQHLLAAKVGGNQPTPEGAQTHPHMQPLIEKISQLEKKIQEDGERYGKYIEKYDSVEKTKLEEADVNFVKQEIMTFQKEFPEINLDERDPDGSALWAKITNWGLQNGYHEFEPAARMFLKQRLADVYASRATNAGRTAVKQDRMNGVIKRSATPFSKGQEPSVKSAGSVRTKSYGDLAEEAKAELRAMSASGA